MLRKDGGTQKGRSMARSQRLIRPAVKADLARARLLAKRMARMLDDDEELPDLALAIALLTSAVVNRYAGDPAKSGEFVKTIRSFEDRLLAKSATPVLKLQ